MERARAGGGGLLRRVLGRVGVHLVKVRVGVRARARVWGRVRVIRSLGV